LAAVAALAVGTTSDREALAALESAASGADPDARALAADALAERDPARAGKLAEHLLPDRVAFNRMLTPGKRALNVDKPLRAAVSQPHYQGIALPHLVARGDVGALSAAAEDRKLPEATRLGAVEALGKVAAEPAEAKLRAIGLAQDEPVELRQAAWRALRRSKRAREAAARSPSPSVAFCT
ncbi:MAG TPA: hypothetical protein VFM54_02355, partial [Micromonosporaceae bacterium]|nr:hypothetical protein [Micromonosporaceae bacterium]